MSSKVFLISKTAVLQEIGVLSLSDLILTFSYVQKMNNFTASFFRLATNLDVLMYACFLKDVLFHLAALSRTLQRRDVTVAEADSELTITKDAIEAMRER